MGWVEVAVVVIVLVMALHMLLTVALIRRVAGLQADSIVTGVGPEAGTPLASVAVKTPAGEQVDVSLAGALVSVLSAGCPSCEQWVDTLAEDIRRGGVDQRVVVLELTLDGELPDYLTRLEGLADVYVLDEIGHPLLRDHRIEIFPFHIVVNEVGLVAGAAPAARDAIAQATAPVS